MHDQLVRLRRYLGCRPRRVVYEAELIQNLLTNWELLHWSSKLAYAIVALTALNTVVYAPIVSIKGIAIGITSAIPYRLPIVGKIRLIQDYHSFKEEI